MISKLRFSMDGSLRMGPFWKGQLEKQVEILNRKCREISVEKLRGELGFHSSRLCSSAEATFPRMGAL